VNTDPTGARTHEDAPRAIDPVCGMIVDPAVAAFASTRGQETIWFCCAGCKKAFDRKPGLYGPVAATGAGPART
jgi:YHS domain-containing protein